MCHQQNTGGGGNTVKRIIKRKEKTAKDRSSNTHYTYSRDVSRETGDKKNPRFDEVSLRGEYFYLWSPPRFKGYAVATVSLETMVSSVTFTSRHRLRLEATWIESRSADNYRRRRVDRQATRPTPNAAHARYPTSAPPHSQSRSHNASGEATLATKDAFSAAVFPKPTTRDVSWYACNGDELGCRRDSSGQLGRLYLNSWILSWKERRMI